MIPFLLYIHTDGEKTDGKKSGINMSGIYMKILQAHPIPPSTRKGGGRRQPKGDGASVKEILYSFDLCMFKFFHNEKSLKC